MCSGAHLAKVNILDSRMVTHVIMCFSNEPGRNEVRGDVNGGEGP